MPFKIQEVVAYNQEIADTSTVQNVPLGTRVKAFDTTLGWGEFIYLKGVASTAIGDAVVFDLSDWTTARTGTGSRGPLAVAQSANIASQFGWYQINGIASVKSATVADNAVVYVTSTAGQLDDAVVSGDKVDGARFRSTDSAGKANLELVYPVLNGNG